MLAFGASLAASLTDMSIRTQAVPVSVILLLAGTAAFSQSVAPAPANAPSVTALIQPVLQNVQRTVGSLNTGRWKTSNDVKASTDRYLGSIQRDLVETLPGLLTQADSAAGSIAPAFAVYRNVDALYDVLLRVNQTAIRSAPENEASSLETSLEGLEMARKQLGDMIAASAADREAQMIKLQAAVKAAAAIPPPPPPKPAVVDDGPPAKPAAKKKRKPAAKPAPAQPAADSGSTPTPPSSN